MDIIRRLYQNEADLGFISFNQATQAMLFQQLDQHELIYEDFLETPLMVLLSADSPLAECPALNYAQLQPYPFYMPKKVQLFINQFSSPFIFHACPDRESRNKMILKQNGFAIVAQMEMIDDIFIQQGLLVLRPLLEDDPAIAPISVGIVYEKKRILKPYEEDFLCLVRQAFSNSNIMPT